MVFFLTAWTPLQSMAQESPRRNEFAAYVGEGHMGGKEGTYGKGAEEGVSIEIRLYRRIGFMAEINRLNHSGSISNVNGTGDHWDISGTAVQTSGSVQPTRFEDKTVKETTAAFQAGAGVRVPIAWGFSFRPEVRVVHADDVHLAHAVFALSYGW
jgi:hypothetical protein